MLSRLHALSERSGIHRRREEGKTLLLFLEIREAVRIARTAHTYAPVHHFARFRHGEPFATVFGMTEMKKVSESLIRAIITCAIAVHEQLGPGFLEAVYQQCLALEMKASGLTFEDQRKIPLVYRGVRISASYRFDFVVEQSVLSETKSVEALAPIHRAQAINYLKLTGLPVALLVNFNVDVLKNGLRRLVHPSVYGKEKDIFVP